MSVQPIPFGGNVSFSGSTVYMAITGGQTSATEAVVSIPIPNVPGSVTDTKVWLPSAPGGSDTVTVTLRVNGADSANAITITGAATSGTSSTDVALVAADLVNYSFTSSLGSYSGFVQVCAEFTPTTGDRVIIFGQAALNTGTNYYSIQGSGLSPNATETDSSQLMPISGRFDGLYWAVDTAPTAGNSVAATLRNTEAATVLTSTIADAATTGNYTTTYAHCLMSAEMALQVVTTGTPASTTIKWSTAFVPNTPGQVPFMLVAADASNGGDTVAGIGYVSATEGTPANFPGYKFISNHTVRNGFFEHFLSPGTGKSWTDGLQIDSAVLASITTKATISDLALSGDTLYRTRAQFSPSGTLNSQITAGSTLRVYVSPSGSPTAAGVKASWTLAPAAPTIVINTASYGGVAPMAHQWVTLQCLTGSTFPSGIESRRLHIRWKVANTAGSPVIEKDIATVHPWYTAETIYPWKNDWTASSWGLRGPVFSGLVKDVSGTDTITCEVYDPASGWATATFTVGDQGGEDQSFMTLASAAPTFIRIGSGLSTGGTAGTASDPHRYTKLETAVSSGDYTGATRVVFYFDYESHDLFTSTTGVTIGKNNVVFMQTPASIESVKTGPLRWNYTGGKNALDPLTFSGTHASLRFGGGLYNYLYINNDQSDSSAVRTAFRLTGKGFGYMGVKSTSGGTYRLQGASVSGSGPYDVTLTIANGTSYFSPWETGVGQTLSVVDGLPSGTPGSNENMPPTDPTTYNVASAVVTGGSDTTVICTYSSDPGTWVANGRVQFCRFHSLHSISGIHEGLVSVDNFSRMEEDDMCPPVSHDHFYLGGNFGSSMTENIMRYIGTGGASKRGSVQYMRYRARWYGTNSGDTRDGGPKDPLRFQSCWDVHVFCIYNGAGRYELGTVGGVTDMQRVRMESIWNTAEGGQTSSTSQPRYDIHEDCKQLTVTNEIHDINGSSNQLHVTATTTAGTDVDAHSLEWAGVTVLVNNTGSADLWRPRLTSQFKVTVDRMNNVLVAPNASWTGKHIHMGTDTMGGTFTEVRNLVTRNYSASTIIAILPGAVNYYRSNSPEFSTLTADPRVINVQYESETVGNFTSGNEFLPSTTAALTGAEPDFFQFECGNGNVIAQDNAYIGAVTGAFVAQVVESSGGGGGANIGLCMMTGCGD